MREKSTPQIHSKIQIRIWGASRPKSAPQGSALEAFEGDMPERKDLLATCTFLLERRPLVCTPFKQEDRVRLNMLEARSRSMPRKCPGMVWGRVPGTSGTSRPGSDTLTGWLTSNYGGVLPISLCVYWFLLVPFFIAGVTLADKVFSLKRSDSLES